MSTNPLSGLFGNNPFRSLQEHMRAVQQAATQVPSLFAALAEGDQDKVVEIQERIFAAEEAADVIKNELRGNLPRGLFMPVNRRDLLEVLDVQDSIADVAQDIAGMLMERPMKLPATFITKLENFAKLSVEVCQDASNVIEQLDELLEMGFRGKEVTHVEELVSVVNRRESESDEMGIELAKTLYAMESEMNPVDVIFLYKLLDWIGDLADYSEKVGDRLRLLIAR